MRNSEKEYWNKVFGSLERKVIKDNVWKRAKIASRLLTHDLFEKKILEIGIGSGAIPLVLDRIFLSKFVYVGTDVSDTACEYNRAMGLNVINTDITNLPTVQGGFDFIFAFDVLEHINHEDRIEGYKEIIGTLADDGRVLMNNPLDDSLHEKQFDPGMTDYDFEVMKECGLKVVVREPYSVVCNGVNLSYEWIEMVKA